MRGVLCEDGRGRINDPTRVGQSTRARILTAVHVSKVSLVIGYLGCALHRQSYNCMRHLMAKQCKAVRSKLFREEPMLL